MDHGVLNKKVDVKGEGGTIIGRDTGSGEGAIYRLLEQGRRKGFMDLRVSFLFFSFAWFGEEEEEEAECLEEIEMECVANSVWGAVGAKEGICRLGTKRGMN